MSDIRINLRTLRAELDVNQAEFAKLIDIPVSTYTKKEVGKSRFTVDEAYKIAKIAKKTVEEFFFTT